MVVISKANLPNGPGAGSTNAILLYHINNNLVSDGGAFVYFANASDKTGSWSVTVAPNGEYIVSGAATFRSTNTDVLTLAALPGATPLASQATRLPAGALQLYPNPATTRVTVQQPNGQAGTVEFYDALGRRQGRPQVLTAGPQATVAVPAGLRVGVYLVRFTTVDGHYATSRLTVE